MAVTATTVKKPSENSPRKRANRRRCERKQTPQNRVRATKGRNWEKTVEDAGLPPKHRIQPPPETAAFRNRALFEMAWFCSALDTVLTSPDNLPCIRNSLS